VTAPTRSPVHAHASDRMVALTVAHDTDHCCHVRIDPDQARTLARALMRAANRVDTTRGRI
jgi:hypothetical protein